MTDSDPLTSPTLAHLYLRQGHEDRALLMLDEILASNPTHGVALAMRRRLVRARRGTLAAGLDEGELCLRWRGIEVRPGLHLVVMTVWSESGSPRVRVESTRHDRTDGERRIPTRPGPASCVACVGGVDRDRGFVAVAVAGPTSW
jgi:hypothetical protein